MKLLSGQFGVALMRRWAITARPWKIVMPTRLWNRQADLNNACMAHSTTQALPGLRYCHGLLMSH